MPTLDFKGKSFVYAHHLSVPFRELLIDPKKSLPAKGKEPSLDDNLVIHGDNLEALKALLPVYAGKVDCIYIDPPYNTGNEGWCYNDNVRSPTKTRRRSIPPTRTSFAEVCPLPASQTGGYPKDPS
jgi:adenine-specific DNA-methyltransferase